jgi:peptidoglycan hydrolase-like protein with peptidoglycan-binding domain
LFAAAAILVVGGILVGAYFETPEEASLRQPPEVVPITDPVRSEVLERALTFRGTLAPAERASARFAVGLEGGIITKIGVAPGDELRSGQVALEVQGRPVIVLSGDFPTWRDFSRGMDRGPDVAQIQRALQELRFYRDKIDGNFGPLSLRAVTRLYRSVGYRSLSKSLVSHQELVFIPRGLRTVDKIDAVVGERLGPDAITLTSDARRIEADLTIDQRQVIQAGATIRVITTGGETWSTVIDRVVSIGAADGTPGPNTAFVTGESPPESMSGEQVFEVILASTDRPVLSVSPAAVHMDGDGSPYVVVLEGTSERRIPVIVGLVTDLRVEITTAVSDGLRPGDDLVLNPTR